MVPTIARRFAAVGSAALLGLGGALAGAVPAHAAGSAVRTCTVADLRLSMGSRDVGAGQLHWPIRFTNRSSRTCVMRGYPGVSVLDRANRQIGAAATRSGQSFGTVTLRSGRTAVAVVHTTNGPIGGPCRATGSSLRVFPPGSFRSALVPAALRVCSNVFSVTPVTAS
ncbi:DUF4232 domain-containing protein [Streptacidiphilus griseoplanus]|uniref:DUF4232 domain-containing protein n=1 Tax=Peterkaempfera griseoplana TaxID=66896 RepID=UPI0006E44034|nr:DUF4232 domain-containing protein [Peterkaempfera griseoplana]